MNAMESGKSEAKAIDQDAQLLLKIQAELQNMGKSLQCPLCLSTLNDPVMSVCLHAFCRECILTSLQGAGKEEFRSKCPVCKFKCTKRGLVSSEHLADLAKGYKLTLRAFGFAPIVYSKGVAMTQLLDDDDDTASVDVDETDPDLSNVQTKSLKSCGDDEEQPTRGKTKGGPSLLRCHEHLEVSRAVHNVLLNAVAKIPDAASSDTLASKPTTSNKIVSWARSQQETRLRNLLRDQEKIIEVDQQALVRAAVTKSRMNSDVATVESAPPMDGKDTDAHSLDTATGVHENEDYAMDNSIRKVDSDSDQDVKPSALPIPSIHKDTIGDTQTGNHASNPSVVTDSRNFPTNPLVKSQIMSTQDLYEASVEELREKEAIDRSAEMLLDFKHNNISPTEDKVTLMDETISRCSSYAEELGADDNAAVHTSDPNTQKQHNSEKFIVGSLVQVQPRTWPGMNKHGGVARITAVHEDMDSAIKYDVSYVLGGKERLVAGIYVSAIIEESTSTKARVKIDKENIHDSRKRASSESAVDVKKDKPNKRSRALKESGSTTQKYLDLAIDCYESRLKEHKNCINIVTSGLNDTDMTTIKVLCAELCEKNVKMKVSDTFHPKNTTLCISSLDKRSEALDNVANFRTLKLMRAALNGVPIMTLSWVAACLEKKELLAPEFSHIVHTLPSKNEELMIIKDDMDSVSARFGVVKLASSKHPSLKKTKTMMDKHFALTCGQFKSPGSPKKADIELLLKESGANLSSSASDFIKTLKNEMKQKHQRSHVGNASVGFILICDDSSSDSTCGIPKEMETVLESTLAEFQVSVVVVTSSWLFDSISCGSLLSCDQYEPLSPMGQSLWRKTKIH